MKRINLELDYKSKNLRIKLLTNDMSPAEFNNLLNNIRDLEKELNHRNYQKKQLKDELIKDREIEEILINNFWDIPPDIFKNKETRNFFLRESDLNQSIHFEKTSFMLNVVVNNNGKELVLNRKELLGSLQKTRVFEKLKKTNSALIRIKSAINDDVKKEIEDFLQQKLMIENLKIHFQKREYGERASMEIILFGDFPVDDE